MHFGATGRGVRRDATTVGLWAKVSIRLVARGADVSKTTVLILHIAVAGAGL